MKKLVLGILIFAIIAVCSAGVYAANCGDTTVCNCGDTLNESRTLNASDNLTGCTGNGINITVSNVVLDCNGYTISGDNTGSNVGVYIKTGLNNVTVRNCMVYNFSGNFEYGIHALSANGTIEYNTVNNCRWGIVADQGVTAFSGTIKGNTISGSGFTGIYSADTLSTNITNNTVYSSNYGIYVAPFLFTTNIWHNNIYNNTKNIFSSGGAAYEASYNNEGNYWGHSCPNVFTANVDSNDVDVVDSYPYDTMDGWLTGDPADCVVCGKDINSSTTLTYNLTNCSGNGLNITTSDIVLDCAGYSISGSDTVYGLYLFAVDNVTVTNCNISNFRNGLYANVSENNSFISNHVHNNTAQGIYLAESPNNNITGGEIAYNNQIGLFGQGGGIYSSLSNDTLIKDIYMHDNQWSAVTLSSSDNSIIQNNNIDENCGGETGIEILNSDNFLITGNNVTNGTGQGISISTSAGQILDNNIRGNSNGGLNVNSASGTLNISGNDIISNVGVGLSLSSITTANVWHNDIYSNSNFQVYYLSAIELSYNNEGNYWGRTSCPVFTAGTDTNAVNVVDSYPYNAYDSWDFAGSPVDCNPQISLSSPANNTNTITNPPDFIFTAISKVNTTLSCELFVDGLSSGSNSTTANNTATTITPSFPLDEEGGGSFSWYVNCTDAIATVQSEIWALTVDSTLPTITLSSPANNSIVNSENVTYTPNDIHLDTCRWYTINTSNPADISWDPASANNSVLNTQQLDLVEGSFYWYINCTDTFGNAGVSETRVLTYDITPPTISSVASSVSSSGATITWTTDENSNSRVDYGKNTSLGSTSSNAAYTTSNSVSLSSLSASTLYYYNVTSCDQAGNCQTEGIYNFTTSSAPVAPPPAPPTVRRTGGIIINKNNIGNTPKTVIMRGVDKAIFTINNRIHYAQIKNIFSNYVTVIVRSPDAIDVDLYMDKTAKVDVDEDGIFDIAMTLEEIYSSSAEITFQVIEELVPEEILVKETPEEKRVIVEEREIIPEEVPQIPEIEEEVQPPKEEEIVSRLPTVITVLALVALIVIIAAGIVYYTKKKK
jgi:parallel beta-helix repeat protein